jgi:DNA-binding transcriptional regulator YdaS (Cro superfamily)
VTTAEKVRALSRDLGSQRRLAELLGVSPAQVTRWRRGQGIDDVLLVRSGRPLALA